MRKLFGDFFKNKTVLITGHTGFIGSWLAIWLNELEANIIGYALSPYTKRDNYVVSNLDKKIKSIIGDIRNYKKLLNIFKNFKPDIVFHLAAQPIVRKSYEIPKYTYDVNVGGTVNIFEAFRKTVNSRVLINLTTDKCYENQECIEGYSENDRLGGYDPYSSSKACSELITSAYKNSFFNTLSSDNQKIVSSARCGNVIGGGDWQDDRLIPDCMKAIIEKKEIIIRNPKSIRPWQYVLEPIRGFLMLAINMWDINEKYSGAWNFGSGTDSLYSVTDIIRKIIKYLGKGSYKIETLKDVNKLHETKVLVLNCKKSYEMLKWKPLLNIDETIEFICDWYMAEDINYDFNVNQIKNYLNNRN